MVLETGRRELRRFRPGDSCDDCNAARWYSDSGFRYCENGHLIESYVPFEHEEEDNFGNRGHTARKQKKTREREARQLSGVDARELFLECLQLLLRKQVAWLQRRHQLRQASGHDECGRMSAPAMDPALSPIAGLESAVRDLWDLRVRSFHGLKVVVPSSGDARKRGGSRSTSRSLSRSRSRSMSRATGGTTSGSESDGRTIYSSQPETSDADGGYNSSGSRVSQERRPKSRSARVWQSGPDERWNLPGIMETLALCYLGGVLLQLPYRIGDFYRWAKNDQIPFLEAVSNLPEEDDAFWSLHLTV
ncbi:hypothetical protein SEPCBS119000_001987 [Sporothrix epigloea]|uniref:RRN7-type domain-containing protein n=1 Tax=Sporothrix epigloea TaxID=1892477 RepID=A0ABP0DDQ1_9PEZI